MTPEASPVVEGLWPGSEPNAASEGIPSAWPAVLFVLVAGLLLCPSTGPDDTHITYWAAHALRTFGALENYNGSRLEQSSSLLFTLVLAAGNALTSVAIPALGGIVSVLSGLLVVVYSGRLAGLVTPGQERAARWLTASSAPLVYWSFSGMETTLHALLFLLAVILTIEELREPAVTRRRLMVVVSVFGALILVRPEAPIVLLLALALAGLVLRRPVDDEARLSPPERRLLPLLAIAAAWSGALLVYRRAYFGAYFPQPVTVKVGLSIHSLMDGLRYLACNWVGGASRNRSPQLFSALLPVMALALAARIRVRRRLRPEEVVTASFAATGLAFVVASGGDWMRSRFLVFLLAPLGVAALEALASLRRRRLRRAAFAALVVLNLGGFISFWRLPHLWSEPPWPPAAGPGDHSRFERLSPSHGNHLRFLPEVDAVVVTLLRKSGGSPVVAETGLGGLLMYYLALRHPGQLHFLDHFALVTPDFARCPQTAAGAAHSALGLILPLDVYLAKLEAIERECGIPRPDLIFDVRATLTPPRSRPIRWNDLPALLSRAGYRLLPVRDRTMPFWMAVRERDAALFQSEHTGPSIADHGKAMQ